MISRVNKFPNDYEKTGFKLSGLAGAFDSRSLALMFTLLFFFAFVKWTSFCCIVVFWTHFDVWLLVSSYLHWLACTMMRSWPWCPAWQLSSTSLAPSLGEGAGGWLVFWMRLMNIARHTSSLFLASSVILSLSYNGSLRKGSKAPVMDLDHQMGHTPPPLAVAGKSRVFGRTLPDRNSTRIDSFIIW